MAGFFASRELQIQHQEQKVYLGQAATTFRTQPPLITTNPQNPPNQQQTNPSPK
jgi:hypothetical protein